MGRHSKKNQSKVAQEEAKPAEDKPVVDAEPKQPESTPPDVKPEEPEWSEDDEGSCSHSEDEDSQGDESDYDESDPDFILWETNVWQKLFMHHMKSMTSMRVWRRWRRIDGMCEVTGLPMLCKKPTTWYTATLMQKSLETPLSDENFMIVCRFVSDVMTGDLLARNKTGTVSLSTIHAFCRIIGNGDLP